MGVRVGRGGDRESGGAQDGRDPPSEGTESKTHFIHHVETLSHTRGDWGIPDTIHRFRVIYRVEKTTGKTVKLRERVRELKGRGG